MKLLSWLCFLAAITVSASADDRHSSADRDIGTLSPEERQLIESFRDNPAPYREILRQDQDRHSHHRPRRQPDAVLGPRDVIDVIVQEGAIAFNGKRAAYEPFSFRICRGETIDVAVRRQKKHAETIITVSFRPDGLHFDVPGGKPDQLSAERGLVIIHEDDRWKNGGFIRFDGTVNSKRSRSEAQGIGFNIRYVANVR